MLCGFNCATQFNLKRGNDGRRRRRRRRRCSEGKITIWESDDWKGISLGGKKHSLVIVFPSFNVG